MSEEYDPRLGKPGEPGEPGTATQGGRGGAGGRGGDAAGLEHYPVRDRRYWTATGIVQRWQFLGVFLLVIVIGVVGFQGLQTRNHKLEKIGKENRVLAQRADQAAQRADELARKIADQRREGIRISCEEQNRQHANAVRSTARLLGNRRAQRKTILDWVGDLVPKLDCGAQVRKLTQQSHG